MTHPPQPTEGPLVTATALALTAFAANSVLCRLALYDQRIDAATFTMVRLASGALLLWLCCRSREPAVPAGSRRDGDWWSAGLLFLYAASFSFAYLQLSTATGALLLFGAVQLTMILAGLRAGERPGRTTWAGLLLAGVGLLVLLSPGWEAPAPGAALLMGISGAAWGGYSLRGRGNQAPLHATAGNFLRAAPLGLGLWLACRSAWQLSGSGLLLAIASGALASALGYVLWYAALRRLTATSAATLQLAVPVLAALGGILFLDESLSLRWLLAAAAVLGGIALAMRRQGSGTRPPN